MAEVPYSLELGLAVLFWAVAIFVIVAGVVIVSDEWRRR